MRVVRGTRTTRKMGQGSSTRGGYDGMLGLSFLEKGSAQNDKSSVLRGVRTREADEHGQACDAIGHGQTRSDRAPDIMAVVVAWPLSLSGTAISLLRAYNTTLTTRGTCSRGCTAPDKVHWWGANIGDDGCMIFAGLAAEDGRTNLSNLLLGGNGLGDRCMLALDELARKGLMRHLRALGLSRNRITDAGCKTLAKSFAAGHWPRLRELYVSSNDLTDDCFSALGVAMAAAAGPRLLEKVSAGDLPRVTARGLAQLLHHLRMDAVSETGLVGGPRLRELALKNLSGLACHDEAQRAEIMTALSSLATEGGSESVTTGRPPRVAAAAPARARQRPLRIFLQKASGCREAALNDPKWIAAAARWVEHGLKVSV